MPQGSGRKPQGSTHGWQGGKGKTTALMKHRAWTKETMVTVSSAAAIRRVSRAAMGEKNKMAKQS